MDKVVLTTLAAVMLSGCVAPEESARVASSKPVAASRPAKLEAAPTANRGVKPPEDPTLINLDIGPLANKKQQLGDPAGKPGL